MTKKKRKVHRHMSQGGCEICGWLGCRSLICQKLIELEERIKAIEKDS